MLRGRCCSDERRRIRCRARGGGVAVGMVAGHRDQGLSGAARRCSEKLLTAEACVMSLERGLLVRCDEVPTDQRQQQESLECRGSRVVRRECEHETKGLIRRPFLNGLHDIINIGHRRY